MTTWRTDWLGPDSGDRYRAVLVALLGLLGTPAVAYGIVVAVEDWAVAGPLVLATVVFAGVVVTRRGSHQAWTPAASAAVLAVLVAATGGADSPLSVAFLLPALASAFLHETRPFVAHLAGIVVLALAPAVYDPPALSVGEVERAVVTALVLCATVVLVHVLSEVLRGRNRRLQVVLDEQRATIVELREAQEVKDLFLSALSHELRTPLTSILGLGRTLQAHDERLDPDQRRDLVARLVVNGQRLQRLLTDLLDLRRLQQGVVDVGASDVHLPQLVDGALVDVPCAGRAIHVDVPDVVVRIDGPKVERILANLVANACKHTLQQGDVWVRVSAGAGMVHLVVEDEGPGVPEELRGTIFEAFRQGPGARTDPSPGTGIGLAIVDWFARLHGGLAWVEDRAGGGAAFHVRLATVAPAGPAGRPQPS